MKSAWKLKFLSKKNFYRNFYKICLSNNNNINNFRNKNNFIKIWDKQNKIPKFYIFNTIKNFESIKVYNGNKFIELKFQKEMLNKSIGNFILTKRITSRIHLKRKKKKFKN